MDQESWDALCIFADALELSFDPRFQTPGQRLGEGISEADSKEVRAILKQAFAAKTTDEWVEFLYTQPEIIWERVRSWSEVLEDEQNIANDYLTHIDVEGVGTTRSVGTLVALSETPGSPKGNPPALGEGNDEVLAQAGISGEIRAEIETHATEQREAFLAELRALAERAAIDQ